MKITIVPLEKDYTLLNCPGIPENEAMFSPILSELSFGYRENGKQVILLSRGENALVMECGAENIFCAVEFLLSNFVNKNKVDTESAYRILEVLFQTPSEISVQRIIYPLFSLLGWLPSGKGEDVYREFPKFSKKLRFLLQNKKVALNEAFLFHVGLYQYGYDLFLDVLPGKLSYSEANQCLRMIVKIVKNNVLKNESCIENNTIFFGAVCEKLRIVNKESLFIEEMRHLRYPEYQRIRDVFSNYISSFRFPSGTVVTTDEYFEKNTFNLSVSFEHREMLEKKLMQILSQLKNQKVDYFDIEKLFAAEKEDVL